MVKICAIANCKNAYESRKGLSFHRFPKDGGLLKLWISRCHRKDPFVAKAARVCSEHFEDDQFVRDLRSELLGDAVKPRRILKDGAVPTRKLPHKTEPAKSPGTGRSVRAAKRQAKRLIDELLVDATEVSGRVQPESQKPKPPSDQAMNAVAVYRVQSESPKPKLPSDQPMNAVAVYGVQPETPKPKPPSEQPMNAVTVDHSESIVTGCQSCTSLRAECDRLRKNAILERNRLQGQIRFWKEVVKRCKTSVEPKELDDLDINLKRILSQGQIQCLKSKRKTNCLSKEHALDLRTVSDKAT